MDGGREWSTMGGGGGGDAAIDEATAVLSVAGQLSEVMAAVHSSGSPTDARRVLRERFGMSRREATLLLTTPVMAFTRSEREILEARRSSRLEFLCEQTGRISPLRDSSSRVDQERSAPRPAEIRSSSVSSTTVHPASVRSPQTSHQQTSHQQSIQQSPHQPPPYPAARSAPTPSLYTGPLISAPPAVADRSGVDAMVSDLDRAMREFDRAVAPEPARLRVVGSDETVPYSSDPEPVREYTPLGPPIRRVTPSHAVALSAYESLAVSLPVNGAQVETAPRYESDTYAEVVTDPYASDDARRQSGPHPADILDEQIGELCAAIAREVGPHGGRDLGLPEISGVDDTVGALTYLRHMRASGLDSVPRLMPFIDPVDPDDARPLGRMLRSAAAEAGTLGGVPSDAGTWSRGLLPIAHRRGHGYAVLHADVDDQGSVWAFDGVDPVERLWDSLVDMLASLYRSLTTGQEFDGAVVRSRGDGRVEWMDLG